MSGVDTVTTIDLWALGYGLIGGFAHCIGMCGVFVLAYAGLPDKGDTRRFLHPERHALFHAGRLFSLTTIESIRVSAINV